MKKPSGFFQKELQRHILGQNMTRIRASKTLFENVPAKGRE